MKKYISIIVLVGIIAVLLAGCTSEKIETPVSEPSTPNVGLIAEGQLIPLNSIDQIFTVSGQVTEILVKDGETVSKGQALVKVAVSPEALAALARAEQEVLSAQQAVDAITKKAELVLSSSRLQVINLSDAAEAAQTRYDNDSSDKNKAILDSAVAELTLAQADLSRIEGGDGIDPELIDAARARLAAAQSNLVSAQAWVDSYGLTASMDGTVIDLDLQAGETVSPGIPGLTIADLSGWLIKTDNLTELEVAQVEVGQQVKIVLDALPDMEFNGEVIHINNRFEEKRGDITYTVTIKLADTDPLMRWGMTAAIRFSE